jgi:Arc/MetJ family transcription regulator
MRTNIDIDDDLMSAAMAAGPYKTKKEAVEAGLALLKRQAAYREILKWKGKLQWGWDEQEPRLDGQPNIVRVAEPQASYRTPQSATPATSATGKAPTGTEARTTSQASATPATKAARHGRR